MSTLNVELPPALLKQVEVLARQDGISVGQFVSSAVSEKLAAMLTPDYLEQRAARSSREEYLRILAKAPDVEPAPEDRL